MGDRLGRGAAGRAWRNGMLAVVDQADLVSGMTGESVDTGVDRPGALALQLDGTVAVADAGGQAAVLRAVRVGQGAVARPVEGGVGEGREGAGGYRWAPVSSKK